MTSRLAFKFGLKASGNFLESETVFLVVQLMYFGFLLRKLPFFCENVCFVVLKISSVLDIKSSFQLFLKARK